MSKTKSEIKTIFGSTINVVSLDNPSRIEGQGLDSRVRYDENLEPSVEMTVQDFIAELREVAGQVSAIKASRLRNAADYFEGMVANVQESWEEVVKASERVIDKHEQGTLAAANDSVSIDNLSKAIGRSE